MNWEFLVLTATSIFGGVKSLGTTIREGELGCRTTFGKAARHKKGDLMGQIKVMSPTRLPIVFPFVQKIHKVHVKDNTTHLENMRITLKNSLSYTFDCYMCYDILPDPRSLEEVLFLREDWEEWLTLKFKTAIQNRLYGYDDKPDKMQKVGEDVKKELEKLLEQDSKQEGNHNCFEINHCGVFNLSETSTSQASRSVDYRIAAAMEHLGVEKLPDCVLAACLGATPTVAPSDCLPDTPIGEREEL